MHYVIGDVHGCRQELEDLLHRVGPGAGDTLLFVGDYIDGGPDSVGVLSLVQELDKQTGSDVVALRGEHEQVLLLALPTENVSYYPYLYKRSPVNWWGIWENMGGRPTAAAMVATWDEDELEDYVSWISEMPLYWSERVEDLNVFVSHAGINPLASDLVNQSTYDLLWSTNWESDYVVRKRRGRKAPWDRIIYGHTPRMYSAGHRKDDLVPVDGGCVQGGHLVAYCIETEEMWTVPRRD